MIICGTGIPQVPHSGDNNKKTVSGSTATAGNKEQAKAEKKDTAAGEDKAQPKKEESTEEKEKKLADNIEKVLKYGLQKERMMAVTKMLTIKTEAIKKQLITMLINLLKDEKDSDVKQKGLTVLGEVKAQESVPLMLASLGDDSEDVRVAAVYALQNIKAASARNRLVEELKKQDLSTDSLYSEALIRCLGTLESAEIIPLAKKAVEDMKTTRNNREVLVLMLGEIGKKDQAEFLLKLYKDEEESVTLRSYAVNSIAKIQFKEAAKDISATINEINSYSYKKKKQYYTLYIYSIAALAKLGDPAAVPHLENALRSESTTVRVKAVELLKELKDKRTIDILKYKMEYDPSVKVRKLAREALKEMGVDVKGKEEKEETDENAEE